MDIKGFQKTSLIDYPGNICATVFTPGCNMRCPFCFNRDLVLQPDRLPVIPRLEILGFLQSRSHLLDGVCISGGEPTLHSGLEGFLREVKSLKLKIKLDTNGTRPRILQALLEGGLLDYIALDIKSPPEKYAFASGGQVDLEEIMSTIVILRKSNIDHEFRTTVIPGLNRNDLVQISRMLEGAQRYVLQPFRPGPILDPSLNTKKALAREELQAVAATCSEYVEKVHIR